MLRNYLKTAWRNFSKNIGFTVLNVGGLAMGLAGCILIFLYLISELSYDSFNSNADRIYRVNTDTKFGNITSSMAIAAPPVAEALKINFPEIENVVRLFAGSERFKLNEQVIQEDKVVYCDSTIFRIFTLHMVAGDPNNALSEPNSIVITKKAAKKYFNSIEVIGRTLSILGDSNIFIVKKITGVIEDLPMESHFHYDFFLSLLDIPISQKKNFNSLYPFSTYILLKKGTNYFSLQAKFPDLMKKNLPFYEGMEKNGDYLKINLTSLKDIHLYSDREHELENNGSIGYVHIFSAIAIFILIIACVNFINLTTAKSSTRAREVGVRKVLGSARSYIITQFVAESMLITSGATIGAAAVSLLLLPLFNQLSGKNLDIGWQTIKRIIPLTIAIILIVGLLAGLYPAFILASFKPSEVLKGKVSRAIKGTIMRGFLVVLQFSISIFLIVGTLVIYDQMAFIQKKDVGYNRDQVIIIRNTGMLGERAQILKQQISQIAGVSNASLSSFIPTGGLRWINYLSYDDKNLQTEFWPIDENYLSTMGMQLLNGRNFSRLLGTDSAAMIINESAAKHLDITKNPLGKTIYYGQDSKAYHIIGVVKNFNFSSLRNSVSPVVMTMTTSFERKKQGGDPDFLCVKVGSSDFPALINKMSAIWKSILPSVRFDYSFMDQEFDSIYSNEQRMGKIFFVFAILAIAIACLGLFGLTAYAVEQRKREISIRRVLGASEFAIVRMFANDFVTLVFVAFLIATPIAWLAMNKWLEGFAYRTNVHWWNLVLPGIAALAIAFVTTSSRSVSAANRKPVTSLRVE
jgi:putative ABC transport system permease protein